MGCAPSAAVWVGVSLAPGVGGRGRRIRGIGLTHFHAVKFSLPATLCHYLTLLPSLVLVMLLVRPELN